MSLPNPCPSKTYGNPNAVPMAVHSKVAKAKRVAQCFTYRSFHADLLYIFARFTCSWAIYRNRPYQKRRSSMLIVRISGLRASCLRSSARQGGQGEGGKGMVNCVITLFYLATRPWPPKVGRDAYSHSSNWKFQRHDHSGGHAAASRT